MSVIDPIKTGGYFLVLVLTAIIALFIWVQFQATMTDTLDGDPFYTQITDIMNELRTSYFYMDYLIPILIGGLMIISFVFAYRAGASIVLAVMSFVVWGIGILISSVYTNVYLTYTATFPSIITDVPMMDFIMTNFKWFMLFWLAIITLLTFRKTTGEESSNLRQQYYG